jgi:hypothetical protein
LWEVSDRFLDGVATSHEVVTLVEVWRDGAYVRDLPVTGGEVVVDEGSKVRRTLSISSSEIDLDPKTAEDLLAPFGTELRVYTGLRFTEGDTEIVPVGVFGIQTAGRSGWLSELGIAGEDRSRAVADSRLLAPYTPNGVSVFDAIVALVSPVIPNVEVYDLTADLLAVNAEASKITFERERWDAVESLAAGIGCEAVFDPEGRLIIREVPQISADTVPVWAIEANTDDAAMIDVSTALSADKVYNAVVATSSAEDVNVTAIVYQSTGALRWRAGFQRPRFYASPLIKTAGQAVTVATAILARSLVYAQAVELESLPNPALTVGDPITVTRPDGTTETRIVSRLSIPLFLAAMTVDTRVGIEAEETDDVGELS